MSLAVWCWYFGTPEPYELYKSLPYTAQSPTLYEDIEYDDQELWAEVERLESENKKFSAGQNLYHVIPLFADCNYFIDNWIWDMIAEYNYVTKFNISLGELDNVSAHRLDCFTIIEKEINNCMGFKNG